VTAPVNPFEAYGIDPRDGPQAITERFRELLEDAKTDEERETLRAAWEELTLHPMRRVRAAFGAHPRSSPSPQPSPGVGGSSVFQPSPGSSGCRSLLSGLAGRGGNRLPPPPGEGWGGGAAAAPTPLRLDPILFSTRNPRN